MGALPETLAGALAYLLLPAVVFLLLDPYKKNHFVRFHSIQCIFFFVIGIALLLLCFAVISPLFVLLISLIAGLALFLVWFVLIVKALQGEMLRLPLIGQLAAKRSPATPATG